MLLLALSLAACGGGGRDPQPAGDLPQEMVAQRIESAQLRRSVTSAPRTLDPALNQDIAGLNLITDLFEGLLQQGADGALLPGVAERWEQTPDGRTWTFHLRPEALWSNGDPVTAADFVFAWQRVVNPATASQVAQYLSPVVGAAEILDGKAAPSTLGATALDARTLQVRLVEPTPYFLSLLINPYFMPVHPATVQREGTSWTQPGRMVSNGAFMLASREINGSIEIVGNPRYWDAGAVRLESIVYIPVTDTAVETSRFLAGDIDVTDRLQIEDLDWLRRSLGEQVRLAPYIGTVLLAMNVQREPFNDVRLRRAMSLALDREVLTGKLFKGAFQPAYGIVSPLPGYVPLEPEWVRLTPEERLELARRLYAEAGYSRERPLRVQYTFPNPNPEMRRMNEAVAAMWRTNLGAEVSLVNEEFRVHQQNRRLRNLALFWNAWIGDYPEPTTFLGLGLKANPQNNSDFVDPEFEAVMAAATAATDPTRRNELYLEAERILDKQAPFIPIYFYRSRHLVRSHVQGWRDSANDVHPSRHLYLAAEP